MSARPPRTLWLLKKKRTGRTRQHIALFTPKTSHRLVDPSEVAALSQPCLGTMIHVVGSPMTGFMHELKRKCDTSSSVENLASAVLLGEIYAGLVVEADHKTFTVDQQPLGKGTLDDLATKIPAPRPSKNFLDPASAVSSCRWDQNCDGY